MEAIFDMDAVVGNIDSGRGIAATSWDDKSLGGCGDGRRRELDVYVRAIVRNYEDDSAERVVEHMGMDTGGRELQRKGEGIG